jgi:Pet100
MLSYYRKCAAIWLKCPCQIASSNPELFEVGAASDRFKLKATMGANLEIFKFSLYLICPLIALVHFGDPDWYNNHVVPVCTITICSSFRARLWLLLVSEQIVPFS